MSSTTESLEPSDSLDQLLSKDGEALLDLIDDLRQYGNAGKDLPQIVVCGDQSSGKSSVLEAISRLSFPRDRNLCTRFATELRIRRGKPSGQCVNILWEKPIKSQEQTSLPSDGSGDLAKVVADATERMKAKHARMNEPKYFKDILRIEAFNPAWPSLTLVDLPGFVVTENKNTVLEIVENYLQEENTIILAVVHTGAHPEKQDILTLFEKYDPKGKRTMGIITMPDRVESNDAAREWIEMAKNKHPKYKFGLGWHVVRNRGDTDDERNSSFQDRDEKETEFFEKSIWNQVGSDNYGINSLRTRLSEILEKRTRKALPSFVRGLQDKLAAYQQKLDKLGPSRLDTLSQNQYLLPLVTKFTTYMENGTAAPSYQPTPGVEDFRPRMKRRADEFHDWMQGWGHTYEIDGFRPDYFPPPKSVRSQCSRAPTRCHLDENSEIVAQEPEILSYQDLMQKAEQVEKSCRARDLEFTLSLVAINKIFKQWSKNWRAIAEAYVGNGFDLAQGFITEVLETAIENEDTAARFKHYILTVKMPAIRTQLEARLGDILHPFEHGTIATHNTSMLAEIFGLLNKWWEKNVWPHLPNPKEQNLQPGEFPSKPSMLINIVQAHYHVLIGGFIDNVAEQVIEVVLVDKLKGLLRPDDISKLDEKTLRYLAGEPEETSIERKRLLQERDEAMKALERCRDELGDTFLFTGPSSPPRLANDAFPFGNSNKFRSSTSSHSSLLSDGSAASFMSSSTLKT